MPLLDHTGWKADDYRRHDEWFEAPAIIVPPETLDEALAQTSGGQRVGVEVPNSFVPKLLLPAQDRVALVVVEFPKFSDGRGFSIGRMLRQQGYKGTLRANGFLVPDEFAFARGCGFDEVEMSEEHAARQPLEQWIEAAKAFSVGYHATPAVGPSIFERRRRAREAA